MLKKLRFCITSNPWLGKASRIVLMSMLVISMSSDYGVAQQAMSDTETLSKAQIDQIYHITNALKQEFADKIDTITKNEDMFQANLTRFPTEVDQKIAAMEKLQDAITAGREGQVAEQFNNIQLQFKERDTRNGLVSTALSETLQQAIVTQKLAVDAALQAQEKEFATQSTYFNSSLTEVKATFSKLLDAQAAQIAAVKDDDVKAIDALKDDTTHSIAAVKDSVTAIDGRSNGIGSSWSVGFNAIMMIIAVAALAISAFRSPHP